MASSSVVMVTRADRLATVLATTS